MGNREDREPCWRQSWEGHCKKEQATRSREDISSGRGWKERGRKGHRCTDDQEGEEAPRKKYYEETQKPNGSEQQNGGRRSWQRRAPKQKNGKRRRLKIRSTGRRG